MKLKATYRMIQANMFVPGFEVFEQQFQVNAEATVPDDSDMAIMEVFAKARTPNGFEFIGLEVVKPLEPHGMNLKQMRKGKGLTLREVEKSTGISNAYLSQLENGKIKKPSYEVIQKLIAFYK